MSHDLLDVLVVGGGQAGLGTGYHLRRVLPRARILIVEAERIGESWERRWDSLRLFTPRRFSRLPGQDFPAGAQEYPDRSEMAAYLRSYTARHGLPVREGTRVDALTHAGGQFTALTARGVLTARQVVVASGPFAVPHRPAFAADLGAQVRQIHTADYRRPADLPAGAVHVIGGGNSAAQLAVELADAGRPVHLIAPRPPWFMPARILGISVYRYLFVTGILNSGSQAPVARYIRRRGDVIVGTELRERVARGHITLTTSRAVAARPDALVLTDGTSAAVTCVLWCTGYRPDTAWICIPAALNPDGSPRHRRGAAPVPGLHWMGLPWQTRLNSSLIDGVDRDAKRTAARVARKLS